MASDAAVSAGAKTVLISMLEHFSYCPRQCALIHVDQSFDENIYTLRGRLAHRKVDQPASRSTGEVKVIRALPLWCERLGLAGKADTVEFRSGVPYPVEHKIGRLKRDSHADLQLCAQALCLEEMTGRPVPAGAVYHVSSNRRREVEFSPQLRACVEETTAAVRAMLASDALPPPTDDCRCRRCSMKESCLPGLVADRGRVQKIVATLFHGY